MTSVGVENNCKKDDLEQQKRRPSQLCGLYGKKLTDDEYVEYGDEMSCYVACMFLSTFTLMCIGEAVRTSRI